MSTAVVAPLPFARPVRDGRAHERRLLVRYHADGDLQAREELVARFMPLARDLALRYSYTDEPFDDLLQVASLGLLKAIDRFEPGRGRCTSIRWPRLRVQAAGRRADLWREQRTAHPRQGLPRREAGPQSHGTP